MQRLIITLCAWLIAAPAWALNVVTTTEDLAAIVRTLGGESVQVQANVKPNQNPHELAAKPGYMRMIHDADWVIAIGADLEAGWLPALMQGARNPDVMPGTHGFTDASVFVRIIQKPAGTVDRSMGDVHPAGNPHYWLAPDNLAAMTDVLAAELKSRLPGEADSIEARHAAWKKRWEEKQAQWQAVLAPFKGLPVVTYHKSFDYLIEFFGLTILGNIEPKPGIPPGSAYLKELSERMKAANVKIMLVEPYYEGDAASLLASQTGALAVAAPTMAGGGPATPDTLALLDFLVQRIAGAMK